MTAIIAPRLENTDGFRRGLIAGRDDACLKWAFERHVMPQTSSFATVIEPVSTLARSAYDPDGCCRPCRSASPTLSAIAKSA